MNSENMSGGTNREEEKQAPEVWIGEEVIIATSGSDYRQHGILESLSTKGLVIRSRTYISWPVGAKSRFGDQQREDTYRVLPTFYPWHLVRLMRLAEDEEKQMENE